MGNTVIDIFDDETSVDTDMVTSLPLTANEELRPWEEERARELQQSIDEIKEMNEYLELRLAERTAELETTNAQLQQLRHQAVMLQRESEARFRILFENMLDGYAFCVMLFDDCGHPANFVYLDVNGSFERLTGLKDVKGKKVTEVIPGIKESNPELFEVYGRVAMSGQAEKFDIRVESLGIWLSVSVYSPQRGYFVAVFDNITEHRQALEELKIMGSDWRPRAYPDGLPNITRREREVLLLVGQGATSKKIAELLGISQKTVEVHRTNLMKKLGATNAAGLARWAAIAERSSNDSTKKNVF